MKTTAAVALSVMMVGTSTYAGGLPEAVMEPEVIVQETASSSSAGIIVPLLLLLLVAAALASGGGGGAAPVPAI